MKFLRQLSVVYASFLFCIEVFAAEPPKPVPASQNSAFSTAASFTPVLPTEFAGWQAKGAVARRDDPAAADQANAPVLKEYGFQRLEKAAYTPHDVRSLKVKASEIAD